MAAYGENSLPLDMAAPDVLDPEDRIGPARRLASAVVCPARIV